MGKTGIPARGSPDIQSDISDIFINIIHDINVFPVSGRRWQPDITRHIRPRTRHFSPEWTMDEPQNPIATRDEQRTPYPAQGQEMDSPSRRLNLPVSRTCRLPLTAGRLHLVARQGGNPGSGREEWGSVGVPQDVQQEMWIKKRTTDGGSWLVVRILKGDLHCNPIHRDVKMTLAR